MLYSEEIFVPSKRCFEYMVEASKLATEGGGGREGYSLSCMAKSRGGRGAPEEQLCMVPSAVGKKANLPGDPRQVRVETT